MLYSEFLTGTGAVDNQASYDEYKRVEQIYMESDHCTKADAYRPAKEAADPQFRHQFDAPALPGDVRQVARMKIQKAQKLLAMDVSTLGLERLQKHKVAILDAWRESRGDYGMEQAIRDGFYKRIASESAMGYSPTDMWLTQNLSTRLDEIVELENALLRRKDDDAD